MSRLEQRLEDDLQTIRGKVIEQAKNVQTGISDAIHALQTGNTKLAYATVLNDLPINRSMRLIDSLCHKFIAIHLPSGTHLRLLSSIIRINIELERMGDYAVVIAREAVQLRSTPESSMSREIDRLATETLLMLKQSIKAFEELNHELAKSTMVMAASMEYNLDIVYEDLSKGALIENTKNSLAIFVIFTQLKRIADQAKNLCEDTIFAAIGEQKAPKVYKILFIDEDNSCLSQLAESIARKNYPNVCDYKSVGRSAAKAINTNLVDFLNSRGVDSSTLSCKSLADMSSHEISQQHVIVSLQGDVSSYIASMPFHTSALEWDIDFNSDSDATDMETLYRTLALYIKDLLELLHGNEV